MHTEQKTHIPTNARAFLAEATPDELAALRAAARALVEAEEAFTNSEAHRTRLLSLRDEQRAKIEQLTRELGGIRQRLAKGETVVRGASVIEREIEDAAQAAQGYVDAAARLADDHERVRVTVSARCDLASAVVDIAGRRMREALAPIVQTLGLDLVAGLHLGPRRAPIEIGNVNGSVVMHLAPFFDVNNTNRIAIDATPWLRQLVDLATSPDAAPFTTDSAPACA